MSWRRVLLAAALLLLVAGCGVSAPPNNTLPVDTPALRALKASAHIQACPRTTAPPTGELPKAVLPCLGGGASVAMASLRGPMLVNVWAQNCGPCRTEMPNVQAFAKKYAGRVAVLGVDYYQDQPDLALGFAKAVGATYPMVADYTPVIQLGGLPTTIFLDAEGKIVYTHPGPFGTESELEQLVAQHLGVKP